MNYQIADRTRHVTVPEHFEDYIAKEVAKLDPLVASFPDDSMLRIVIDDASGVDDVEITMRLSLMNNQLSSSETGSQTEIRSVFSHALKQLRRQLLDFKEQL